MLRPKTSSSASSQINRIAADPATLSPFSAEKGKSAPVFCVFKRVRRRHAGLLGNFFVVRQGVISYFHSKLTRNPDIYAQIPSPASDTLVALR